MLGQALIGIGGSLVQGLLGSSSARRAAREQAAAQQSAISEMRRQFDETQRLLSPYTEAGTRAISQFNRLIGLAGEAPDYSLFTSSPEYQFALQQGQQALERSAAARGGLFSGNTGVALTEFGQGLASQQFGNYMNRLMQLMGIGQSAAAGTAGAGERMASGIADTLTGIGDTRASGIMGASNAWTNALGQLGGFAMDYLDRRDQRSTGITRTPNPGRGGGMAPIHVPMRDFRLDESLVPARQFPIRY